MERSNVWSEDVLVVYNTVSCLNLLEGKTALILGVANKWSLAYAIAQAFQREGARLLLTYQGERLQKTVEELGAERWARPASSNAT